FSVTPLVSSESCSAVTRRTRKPTAGNRSVSIWPCACSIHDSRADLISSRLSPEAVAAPGYHGISRCAVCLARACCKRAFFAAAPEDCFLIEKRQPLEAFLETLPSVDTLAHLRVGRSGHIIAGGFAGGTPVTNVQMWPMLGTTMVATAAWRAAGAIGLGKRPKDSLPGQ